MNSGNTILELHVIEKNHADFFAPLFFDDKQLCIFSFLLFASLNCIVAAFKTFAILTSLDLFAIF
jgi:predicted ABC-type sugar transport system permease subunit